MYQILDGSSIAKKKRELLKQKVDALKQEGIIPHLSVILVGDNNPSAVYVKHKQKNAEEIGISLDIIALSEHSTQEEITRIIHSLNDEPTVHGILLQLPTPPSIDHFQLLSQITPLKDVDGLTPYNAGRLLQGHHPYFFPATPKGIHIMLKEHAIDVKGKHVVIMGRSIIVGRPLAALMTSLHATVTLTHSFTQQVEEITKQADILIVAIGKPHFVTPEYVKEGAIVIDVGINTLEGKLTGDVDFTSVAKKVSYISPVPKGVGPLTIFSLLENVYEAALLNTRH